MQRAGIGLADAEHRCELGVAEAGVELERDQLAIASRQRGERRPHGSPPQRLILVVGDGLPAPVKVLGVDHQRRQPAAAAQLIERRVSRDPEQPSALLTPTAVERAHDVGRRVRMPAQ